MKSNQEKIMFFIERKSYTSIPEIMALFQLSFDEVLTIVNNLKECKKVVRLGELQLQSASKMRINLAEDEENEEEDIWEDEDEKEKDEDEEEAGEKDPPIDLTETESWLRSCLAEAQKVIQSKEESSMEEKIKFWSGPVKAAEETLKSLQKGPENNTYKIAGTFVLPDGSELCFKVRFDVFERRLYISECGTILQHLLKSYSQKEIAQFLYERSDMKIRHNEILRILTQDSFYRDFNIITEFADMTATFICMMNGAIPQTKPETDGKE